MIFIYFTACNALNVYFRVIQEHIVLRADHPTPFHTPFPPDTLT